MAKRGRKKRMGGFIIGKRPEGLEKRIVTGKYDTLVRVAIELWKMDETGVDHSVQIPVKQFEEEKYNVGSILMNGRRQGVRMGVYERSGIWHTFVRGTYVRRKKEDVD